MSEGVLLREQVFFCVADRLGVFLDLNTDSYSAVEFPNRPRDDAELQEFLQLHRELLAEEGLLASSARDGRAPSADAVRQTPSGNILADDRRAFGYSGTCTGGGVSFGDSVNFYKACIQASTLLRNKPIADVMSWIWSLRSTTSTQNTDAELRRRVLAFRTLRPWYRRQYRCLFDSLALRAYLARYHLDADLVLGVQAAPFGAHCWLEVDGFVLNESVEFASQFTPILVV